MGVAERKERERAHREQSIVDAAEKVFFAKGLEAATMDEVAATAELSKGTVYLYFRSKEELYQAIILRALRLVKSLFTKAIKEATTGMDKTSAIGLAYLHYYKTYPNYFKAACYDQAVELDPTGPQSELTIELMETAQGINGILAAQLQLGIDDGSIRPDIDPEEICLRLWAQCTGLLQFLTTKKVHMKTGRIVDPEVFYLNYMRDTREFLTPKR